MFGLSFEEITTCHMILSILFLISYLRVFRKKEWICNYDADELKVVNDCEDSGRIIIKYTFLGAVLRSVGLGGIVTFVMYITFSIWHNVLNLMTWEILWIIMGNEYGFIFFCSALTTVLYFIKIKENIIGYI